MNRPITPSQSSPEALSPGGAAPETDRLTSLLRHPELWRAGQLEHASAEPLLSGFAELDAHLPGGGWPRDALAELLLPTAGLGELRLLLPLIRTLSRSEARWVAWIQPPFIPYAPALAAAGVDVRKILLVHPRTHQQALWALERASRSGTCSLALGWLDERRLELKDTRRLQLASRRGRTLTCLFRPRAAADATSMAELRLAVEPDDTAPDTVVVNIHKRRGGWPVHDLRLQLGDGPGPAEIHEQLSLWRATQRRNEPAVPESPVHDPGRVPPDPARDDVSRRDGVSRGDGVSRITH